MRYYTTSFIPPLFYFFAFPLCAIILQNNVGTKPLNKTIDDDLVYFPNDDKQNYHIKWLNLLVKKFRHYYTEKN